MPRIDTSTWRKTGVAVTLGLPVRLISIDGTRPPAFVQHLDAIDLQRERQAKPWLSDQDTWIDGLLRTLTD